MNIIELLSMKPGDAIKGLYISDSKYTPDIDWTIAYTKQERLGNPSVRLALFDNQKIEQSILLNNLVPHYLGDTTKNPLRLFKKTKVPVKFDEYYAVENNFYNWYKVRNIEEMNAGSIEVPMKYINVDTEGIVGLLVGKVILMLHQEKVGLLLQILIRDNLGWLFLLANNAGQEMELQ